MSLIRDRLWKETLYLNSVPATEALIRGKLLGFCAKTVFCSLNLDAESFRI